MSERLRRILFISFFVLFAGIVGVGVYYYFFAQPEVVVEAPPEDVGPGGTLPGAGDADERQPTVPGAPGTLAPAGTVPGAGATGGTVQPQTVLLRESITQEVSPSADGTGARYYDPIESRFYRVTTDGVNELISDTEFPNVETVSWGNSTDQAILTFPDGTKLHYNFETETQTSLPKHWDAFDFAADDQEVVAKSNAVAPESRYLLIADPNGKNARAVQPLGDNADEVYPYWTPNEQVIAYSTVGDALGFDRERIQLLGQNQENFTGLVVEGRGFQPVWSPDGNTVLYSVWNAASNYRPELWVSGGAPGNINENRIQLGVITFANKCAWANEMTVYCGV
ncbi:hypothetical protein GF380_00650, partial [Candidatus Uhrbacteria bacterium]|nr:hypothetical protein [Candidatus Uhrbacteria bacterium]MBD3283881.1 hypothetical protein [Candidatus Uhrbacteria bacterium]